MGLLTRATARRTVAVVLGVCGVVLLAGCASERSLGVAIDEVASVQFYEYPWAAAPGTVERLTIDNPEVLREFVDAFTDMPVQDVTLTDDEIAGEQTQATRFVLTDGSTVEVTKIWLGPHNLIVFWPDGTVSTTEWGSPELFAAYEDVGEVDVVSSDELPKATLPD